MGPLRLPLTDLAIATDQKVPVLMRTREPLRRALPSPVRWNFKRVGRVGIGERP